MLQGLASSLRLQQIRQTSHHAKLQHTPPSRGSSLASAFDDGLDGTRTEVADEEHLSLVLLLAELAWAGILIIYGILCIGGHFGTRLRNFLASSLLHDPPLYCTTFWYQQANYN